MESSQKLSDSIRYSEQYISGLGSYHSPHEMLTIVYIADTGSDGDFDWLINEKKYHISAGDFVLFNHSDSRLPLVRRSLTDIRIHVIRFFPVAVFGFDPLEIFWGGARTHRIPANMGTGLLPTFNRIADECRRDDSFSLEAAKSALRLLLIDMARILPECGEISAVDRTAQSHAALLAHIVNHLREHIAEPLTIKSVAAAHGISESSLSRMFKQLLSMSFPDYLRRLRIQRVVYLVTAKGQGVLDSALEAGFGSVSGFYKSFRAVIGTSPSEHFKSIRFPEK